MTSPTRLLERLREEHRAVQNLRPEVSYARFVLSEQRRRCNKLRGLARDAQIALLEAIRMAEIECGIDTSSRLSPLYEEVRQTSDDLVMEDCRLTDLEDSTTALECKYQDTETALLSTLALFYNAHDSTWSMENDSERSTRQSQRSVAPSYYLSAADQYLLERSAVQELEDKLESIDPAHKYILPTPKSDPTHESYDRMIGLQVRQTPLASQWTGSQGSLNGIPSSDDPDYRQHIPILPGSASPTLPFLGTRTEGSSEEDFPLALQLGNNSDSDSDTLMDFPFTSPYSWLGNVPEAFNARRKIVVQKLETARRRGRILRQTCLEDGYDPDVSSHFASISHASLFSVNQDDYSQHVAPESCTGSDSAISVERHSDDIRRSRDRVNKWLLDILESTSIERLLYRNFLSTSQVQFSSDKNFLAGLARDFWWSDQTVLGLWVGSSDTGFSDGGDGRPELVPSQCHTDPASWPCDPGIDGLGKRLVSLIRQTRSCHI